MNQDDPNFKKLFSPLKFSSGKSLKNRITLAPLTNMQSHEDGTLSEDEFKWLAMRALGGYSLTMTCASHVQEIGKGFPGQLGIFSDSHLEGLTKLASEIAKHDSIGIVQLHHAGMRSPEKLLSAKPVSPSNQYDDNGELMARELSLDETHQLITDFALAAKRAEDAGFQGVEIHGAHGYILTQYLSKKYNKRTDDFGGSFENRARIFFDIIQKTRELTSPNFIVGLRLSPELHGLDLSEVLSLSQKLIDTNMLDFLDISLWDAFKKAEDPNYSDKELIELFADLNWKETKFVVAGKIFSAKDIAWCLDKGADFVAQGKVAILHHDFPNLLKNDINTLPIETPVTRDHLKKEGLGEKFIDYMANRWDGFVK